MCQDFNTTWAWELEKKGYMEMSMESKAGILKVRPAASVIFPPILLHQTPGLIYLVIQVNTHNVLGV